MSAHVSAQLHTCSPRTSPPLTTLVGTSINRNQGEHVIQRSLNQILSGCKLFSGRNQHNNNKSNKQGPASPGHTCIYQLSSSQDKLDLIPITNQVANLIDNIITPFTSHELINTLLTTLWHWITTPLPTKHSQMHRSPQTLYNAEAVL